MTDFESNRVSIGPNVSFAARFINKSVSYQVRRKTYLLAQVFTMFIKFCRFAPSLIRKSSSTVRNSPESAYTADVFGFTIFGFCGNIRPTRANGIRFFSDRVQPTYSDTTYCISHETWLFDLLPTA